MIAEQKMDLGGEWFDGVSGINSQSRYVTNEEILKRIEDRKMKKLMKAMLEEIERIEQEDRVAAFEADIQRDDTAD
jgi:ABC-type siderophore export system fused ATPase/permease subunit